VVLESVILFFLLFLYQKSFGLRNISGAKFLCSTRNKSIVVVSYDNSLVPKRFKEAFPLFTHKEGLAFNCRTLL
jgi:hypothetical protein